MDGSGYPQFWCFISEARILAVADTVEAMASHRPYRATGEAGLEIPRNKVVLYDHRVVDACMSYLNKKDSTFRPRWKISKGISSCQQI
jgi:HD-GYP domain-containing protein (c-di-GMP phosphodiesterase class II)